MPYSIKSIPKEYESILKKSRSLNFSMHSDEELGSFIRLLTLSKKEGNILELGTGTGMSLSWILDGLDPNGKVTSIENDPDCLDVARSFFAKDHRVSFVQEDAKTWIKKNSTLQFDLIFADTWAGKFSCLNKTLEMVKPGRFYIVDDLNQQENWPEGHQDKVLSLVETLKNKNQFFVLQIDLGSGIMILCRKPL